ncbi:tRNA (adenosine(37)-N6)-threonylcarbamoyltransferase complex dimerization subunit type 1 TsaB [Rivularia sp. UHCC 0363]|nr:tRNA (adenosine(37)-N6)-threonylcarbamoyltransferase complex dimerization subunit type 1 TsaB [Rivularia sp. UHCC 0363]MEA5593016.1 tRNA (adenosine(37)-N6)-threonylcarbamoyltransferase complex dimerization subunit type 1 TsaB [Rivularia sp. UHCC 0363]
MPKMKQYGFALHTTTPELGLAISNFADDSRSNVWKLDRNISNLMHQYLMEFIKPQTWADIAFVSVAKGPGGFTGTRIGLVAARTLGQQLNIPVFAISTLAAFAWENRSNDDTFIAVQMPAQRGMIFAAIYQITPDGNGLTAVMPDMIITPEAWREKLADWNENYQLVEANSGLAATVTSMLQLAYLDWQQGKRPDWTQALPFYGQHPVDG